LAIKRNQTEKLDSLLRTSAVPTGDWTIYDAVIRYRFETLAEINNLMRNHQVELGSAAENNTAYKSSNNNPYTRRTKITSKRVPDPLLS